MKERPILFSGPMVKALLAGTKTQTRRIVKPSLIAWIDPLDGDEFQFKGKRYTRRELCLQCPYGQPGDRLWVKETWHPSARMGVEVELEYLADESARLVTCQPDDLKPTIDRMLAKRAWVPSIFMPRWASRITLEVVSVRVERLQDISEADAWQEGITDLSDAMNSRPLQTFANLCMAFPKTDLGRLAADDMKLFQFGNDPKQRSDYEKVVGTTGRGCYAYLWESINGQGSWAKNPFVWVVEFRRIKP